MTKYSREGRLVHSQSGVSVLPIGAGKTVISPRFRVKVEKPNATNPGYKLGLVMNKRQEFTDYSWSKVLAVAKKETGENRLRTEIHVYGWSEDGKRDDRFNQEFTGDGAKEAIAYAKEVVAEGLWHSSYVTGYASRPFAQRGFGDRAVFDLAHVERIE